MKLILINPAHADAVRDHVGRRIHADGVIVDVLNSHYARLIQDGVLAVQDEPDKQKSKTKDASNEPQ